MKEIYKRILVILIVLAIVFCLFMLVVEIAKRTKTYKYLTYEDTWGTSKNCYETNTHYFACEKNGETIFVKQYYWED